MTTDFDAVFASIAMGSTEDGNHDFVDPRYHPVLRAPLLLGGGEWLRVDVSVVDGVGGGVCEVFGEDMGKNLKRLRA